MNPHRSLYLAGLVLAMGAMTSAAENPGYSSTVQAAPATVSVRYFVTNVREAVDFYTRQLGFSAELNAAPNFAIVARGNLHLLLSAVEGSGGGSRAMADGRKPEPGGWNRIQLSVTDLAAEVARLRAAGAHFRNDIVKGNGGDQILLEDPSGNPIELWQPGRR